MMYSNGLKGVLAQESDMNLSLIHIYQANSQTIKTQDEIMQVLMNLK